MPHPHPDDPHGFDLDAELEYWRAVHAIGRLGHHDFDQYRHLLRMGLEVYRAWPDASEEQRYRVLQDSYHRRAPGLAVAWDEARWLVRHAWQHAGQARALH
ncbi:hypothetical protein [Stenotrophomonas mori]|uniref:Uncharacterized protein n=1 Tax=Stenotrophomonas mori TaxID=2871096 RepID=A0ABT0SIA7_9GAMM|nr:hypothetical protein [Stenotrophomonas mori]MCL7714664.1 hypothetical protein [Stenotrophomonas mori]